MHSVQSRSRSTPTGARSRAGAWRPTWSRPPRAPTSTRSTSSCVCASAVRCARRSKASDMTSTDNINLWRNAEHALAYLQNRDSIPHRTEGYAAMLEVLPEHVARVLDLGTGDGNVLALVLAARPDAGGVGLDFQPEMLDRARERFTAIDAVEIRRHDLDEPLPADLGQFDVVVSGFAIH